MTPDRPLTLEVEFRGVDPATLDVLTGGALGDAPAQEFSVEVFAPIRRTFWQWLRRRPRQYRRVLVPRARLEVGP